MQLQLIYDEIAEKKQKGKDLKEMYKDALRNADEYDKITDQMNQLKEKKKQIESRIQAQLGKAWEELEDLKCEVQGKKVMLTDLALRDLMDGKTVKVKDEAGSEYEPIWSVKFRKVQ